MNKQLIKLSKTDDKLTGELLDLSPKEGDVLSQYIKIRNAYFRLHMFEENGSERTPEIRAELNTMYQEFVQLYGRMSATRKGIKNLLLQDPYGFLLMSSLEVKINQEIQDANVLIRSPRGEVEVFRTENVHDALAWCLGIHGTVDLGVISAVTDKEQDEILRELGDRVYMEPQTKQFQTADKYLSGNVYQKMLVAEKEYEKHWETPLREQLQRSWNAIIEVQPPKIPWELLSEHINCGERWVPISYFEDFSRELLETKLFVRYFAHLDKFKLDPQGGYSRKATTDYFVRGHKSRTTANGYELIEHALENTCPQFTYTVGIAPDQKTLIDSDAVQLANQKIEDIRNQFGIWLQALSPERKEELVNIYNNLYNCYVIRKYNGSHLKLPGIDLSKLGKDNTSIELYGAQKDGIWRIIADKGGIIDWEVGAGKTLCMVVAAHEMKRMGIRNKPAILCLKANVQDVVNTYRKAYPSAKVLSPGEQDFDPKNRVRLFHEMKNNDWDCIIMTHDQFGKINQDPEVEMEVMQEEIDGLEKDLQTLKSCGHQISKAMKKGLEKRKASMDAAMKKKRAQISEKKDDDINFTDIGIDHLLIDEAHKFKNLQFTTRHERVAGLGNQTGSQKATNMLFAIRTLQKRFNSDLQVTFLSGTPISNSLTEMYLLFKYLRPRELERQNISNFDGWAAVFAKKTTDFEFSVTNQIIAKERFRHFIKVPELALFYNEIADFRTKKMINIEEPQMVEELVNLAPTEDQQEYIINLIKFAETGDGVYIDRPPLTEGEQKAKMLIATNMAKKMSMDMRLVNKVLYDDHPNNKATVCCENVKRFYDSSMEFKGTQLIFCDLGTPGTEGFNVYEELKKKLVEVHEIPVAEITFIHDWNEKNKHLLFKKMNDGDIRVLIGSTDKAGTGLNVQQRVVAMHQLDIPWKPAELTQRVGRGVRPGNWGAKLYQDNKVYNFIYATERSLDNYKFTLLKNKQTFIAQMKNNELQTRSIDEGSIDEQSGMNFAEYIAVLSGDTTLLEKAKIDKKLAVLEKLRSAHYREISNNKYLLAHKKERIEIVEPLVVDLKRDYEQYQGVMTKDENGLKDNPIDVPGCQEVIESEKAKWEDIKVRRKLIEESEEIEHTEKRIMLKALRKEEEEVKDRPVVIGEYLMRFFKSWEGTSPEKIGTLYGFDLYIEKGDVQSREIESDLTRSIMGSNTNLVHKNKFFAQHPSGGLRYTYNHGVPSFSSPRICCRQFLNSLERIDNLYDTYSGEKKTLIRDIEALELMDVKPFQKEDEIEYLKSESKRLEKEISIKIGKKEVVTI